MNIELTRIQNQQKQEGMITEKSKKAVSKPINMDKQASANDINDANPVKRIKCYLQQLDGVTSMKLYYGCQLGNLLEKCFIQGKDTYKDALMECKFKIKWAYFLRYRSEEKTYLLCS